MTSKKLKKVLRKFENSSTILHEYFYEILENENCYTQIASILNNTPNELKQKLIDNKCAVIDFIYLIDFFSNKEYEKN